jgi:hypothetical protein
LRADECSKEERKDIDDRVPPELAHLILQFDGSVLVDRTWGEVAGWCAAEAANLLGLKMVHALVTGKPSVEARHRGAEHRRLPRPRRAVCRAAAVRGPQGGTEDLEGSKRSGAVLQQMAGRRKDAVTGGEEATDRRTRADARRGCWSRNLPEGFRPRQRGCGPRSAARLGVI